MKLAAIFGVAGTVLVLAGDHSEHDILTRLAGVVIWIAALYIVSHRED